MSTGLVFERESQANIINFENFRSPPSKLDFLKNFRCVAKKKKVTRFKNFGSSLLPNGDLDPQLTNEEMYFDCIKILTLDVPIAEGRC